MCISIEEWLILLVGSKQKSSNPYSYAAVLYPMETYYQRGHDCLNLGLKQSNQEQGDVDREMLVRIVP